MWCAVSGMLAKYLLCLLASEEGPSINGCTANGYPRHNGRSDELFCCLLPEETKQAGKVYSSAGAG